MGSGGGGESDDYLARIAHAVDDLQEVLTDFHEKFGRGVGSVPGVRDAYLQVSLVEEESGETVRAIRRGDLVEAVDGLCDTIYTCLGAAVSFGVRLGPIFAEVHRTNMLKEGGARRADGKILKPEGWRPPDVAGLLRRQEQEMNKLLTPG